MVGDGLPVAEPDRSRSAFVYPERGLVLIVPYPAGGGTNVSARLLARDLEIALGKRRVLLPCARSRRTNGRSSTPIGQLFGAD